MQYAYSIDATMCFQSTENTNIAMSWPDNDMRESQTHWSGEGLVWWRRRFGAITVEHSQPVTVSLYDRLSVPCTAFLG